MLKAYETLHMKAKVVHDNFVRTRRDHLNVLYNNMLNQAFVVNFGRAQLKHRCRLRMPLYEEYASTPPDMVFGCEELLAASCEVGMSQPESCAFLIQVCVQ